MLPNQKSIALSMKITGSEQTIISRHQPASGTGKPLSLGEAADRLGAFFQDQPIELSSVADVHAYLAPYQKLPGGTLLYQLTPAGRLFVTGDGGPIQEVSRDNPKYKEILPDFVTQGAKAFYLVGSPESKNDEPATFKMGMESAGLVFEPHAHGVDHIITSFGFAACYLADEKLEGVATVRLIPGSMIDIKQWVAHSVANRSAEELVLHIVNRGLGINHPDYAVTLEEAENRNMTTLADLLKRIKDHAASIGIPGLSPYEKIAQDAMALALRLAMRG